MFVHLEQQIFLTTSSSCHTDGVVSILLLREQKVHLTSQQTQQHGWMTGCWSCFVVAIRYSVCAGPNHRQRSLQPSCFRVRSAGPQPHWHHWWSWLETLHVCSLACVYVFLVSTHKHDVDLLSPSSGNESIYTNAVDAYSTSLFECNPSTEQQVSFFSGTTFLQIFFFFFLLSCSGKWVRNLHLPQPY